MKYIITYLFLTLCFFSISQQNTLLLNTFFKDHLFNNSKSNYYQETGFLPVIESQYNLQEQTRDSSKQYYEFTEVLFKKHLIEAKGNNYYLTISPILDFNLGKDLSDTTSRRLFQNTRGVFVEGDLFKNFSFSTAFFENQGRFSNYETNYYSSIGELYPNQSAGTYTTQNAVIPGSGRTKPFKVDGFDYAYAIGNIVYKPHRSIILSTGNTSHFIGEGYRSLFLSDNSVPAPFFRGIVNISKKLQFNYFRMRLINLIRKPVSTTVEAYYETKAFSANYLTFLPTKKLSISLFEGIIWSKGDSIVSKKVNPLYYNPIPFIAELILDEKEINSVIGLNISYTPYLSHRIYGQIGIGNLNIKNIAYQIGYRGYSYFGLKNFMIQAEFNSVADGMYESLNSRLNYGHYNLPMGHAKGNNFQEIVFRCNYEWKRLYADLKTICYFLKDYNALSLIPVDKNISLENGTLFLQQLELGYRFNKKMNLTIFGNWSYRNPSNIATANTNQIFIGLRTGINNHYNDF